MPRKASGKHEAQRERTRRYRKRLRASGTPEADQVDAAVAASVSAVLELLRLRHEDTEGALREKREEKRLQLELGVLSEEEAIAVKAELAQPLVVPEAEPLTPDDLVHRILLGAIALLVDRGCNPAAAKRRVRYRMRRGGDLAQMAVLIHRSGVTIKPGRRRRSSRAYDA